MSESSLPWPESVAILTEEEGHVLDKKPAKDGLPNTPIDWARFEIDPMEATKSQKDLMLDIWKYRYDCLTTFRTKYRHTFNNYDHYNAAWVACGYADGQSSNAIELCRLRFSDPTGEVLDDPNLTVKKSVPVKKTTKRKLASV